MNNTFARVGESVSLIILFLLLTLLLNPFDILMLSMMHTMLIGFVSVVFLAILLFMFGQTVHDERENVHRMFSDRLALLVGASVLMLSLIHSSITEKTEQSWVIITLGLMAVTKYVAMQYARRYK